MKKTLFALITFFSITINAQSNYEKGYFIDNQGTKTECFVKNLDWRYNPTEFNYKLEESTSESKTKIINEVKEFSIPGVFKFIRETLEIDQSSQNDYTLTLNPAPDFKTQTIFLKVLVEGNSNLYYYENSLINRYFYSVDNKIEQLIYKRYKGKDGNNLFNERFKQQLFTTFICSPEDKNKILNLKYNDQLIDYFIKTNNCKNGGNPAVEVSKKRDFEINFKLNALVNNVTTKLKNTDNGITNSEDKSSKTNISFGFESEIILPYRNKNWSVIFDPSYVTKNDNFNIVYKPEYVNADYKAETKNKIIRLPLGIRHYFSKNTDGKFFINASVGVNFSYCDITINGRTNSQHGILFNFPIGLGYQYKKYSLELKYFTTNALTNGQITRNDKYTLGQISMKLGYKLF